MGCVTLSNPQVGQDIKLNKKEKVFFFFYKLCRFQQNESVWVLKNSEIMFPHLLYLMALVSACEDLLKTIMSSKYIRINPCVQV